MARNFAGGTDSVPFGAINRGGPAAACVAFWMKTSGATANTHVASAWTSSSREGFGFLLNVSAGKITAQCYNTTGTPAVNLTGATTVNNGNWHHVAFNWNKANGSAQSLYVDGASDASGTASAAWDYSGVGLSQLVFGDPLDAFWGSYNGDIAEFYMFPRNLDAAEIAALAKGLSPHDPSNQPGFAYIPFVRSPSNRCDGTIGTITGTTVSAHCRVSGSQP